MRNHKIILLGVFNINLLIDDRSNSLFVTEMQSLLFSNLISKPTRFPTNNSEILPSLLDHIWVNTFVGCTSGILLSDISDHLPVFIHLDCAVASSETKKVQFRFFNERNLTNFTRDLNNIEWNSVLGEDVNIGFSKFNDLINDLYCKNFPIKTKLISTKRLSKPWLSGGILQSIKRKSHYFKLLKLGWMSQSEYNTYKNKLTTVIRYAKENYFKNLFMLNKKNSKKIWSTFRDLFGRNGKNGSINEVLLNGTTLNSDLDISNAFNDYFSSVGSNLDSNLAHSNKHFSDFMNSVSPFSFFIQPTTPEEISEIILALKRKNSNLHEIPVSILVKVRNLLSVPLSKIINLSFKNGIFPDLLKCANIIPIHKSGPMDEIKNFRPISILPTYSKIFEKCMASRLV